MLRKRLKHLRRVKPKRTKFKLVLNGPKEAGKPTVVLRHFLAFLHTLIFTNHSFLLIYPALDRCNIISKLWLFIFPNTFIHQDGKQARWATAMVKGGG